MTFHQSIRQLAVGSTALVLMVFTAPGNADAPGGFLEKAGSGAVRPVLSQTEIRNILPTRGKFVFPPPYDTEAIRLTNSSDCNGNDCVHSIGYSYWRNINNHAGSDTMLIFLGLNNSRGGNGPTLFEYNKVTDQLNKLGPLFESGSQFASASGEGWYFSATMPTKLYVFNGPKLLRYDVLSKQFDTVFDVSGKFGSDKIIWQTHSSNDDRVHSATMRSTSNWAMLGCVVYREDTSQFLYYPKKGDYDECQIDKSGRWLVIKENVDGTAGEDNRIIDIETGNERVLLDQDGAAGHSDMGYGSMIAADNWANQSNTQRVWNLADSALQGTVAYYNQDWNAAAPAHLSYANAHSGVALDEQYACGSSANSNNSQHANEIICFSLDGSRDTLVVAPVMTDMYTSGGGDSYSKMPKGNVDVTGQYFIWTSNMGGNRQDAFLVKIPSQHLTAEIDVTAPTVSINTPLADATLSGVIAVSASASDNVGVTGVQFKLDGTNLGAEDTTAPYSVGLDTTSIIVGTHTLTAVARDAAGNTATSNAISVSTLGDTTPPVIGNIKATVTGSTSTTVEWATDEPATAQLEYGLTTSYGNSTALGTDPSTNHSATLSELTAGTSYHYRVLAWDESGNFAASADHTFTTGSESAPPSATDPVARWEFAELSGVTVQDTSGNGNAGRLVNGPKRYVDEIGQALRLDGKNDYMQVQHADGLNAFPLTVALWLKTDATGLHGIVNKYWPSSMNGYQLFVNNGALCAWYFRNGTDHVWDGSGCTLRTTGFADDQWHHVAFVVDADGGRLYVDGSHTASQAWNGSAGAATSAQDVAIGSYPGTGNPYLSGSVGDVRIYQRALTATEISALHEADTTPVSEDVAWVEMVNVTADGNTLQKSGGCDGCQDAGAISDRQISSGDGYLEFTASTENGLRYIGLSNGNNDTSASDIDFGLRMQNNYIEVRENGSYKWDTQLTSGDIFRIAVEAGEIRYYRNGTLFYTSATAPGYPLRADSALASLWTTVQDAKLVTHP